MIIRRANSTVWLPSAAPVQRCCAAITDLNWLVRQWPTGRMATLRLASSNTNRRGPQYGRDRRNSNKAASTSGVLNRPGESGDCDVPRVSWSRVAGFQATGWVVW